MRRWKHCASWPRRGSCAGTMRLWSAIAVAGDFPVCPAQFCRPQFDRPDFKRGIGDLLLCTAWNRIVDRGRCLYMMSRNAGIIEWMRAQGMTISESILLAPLAVHVWMPVYMSSWHRTKDHSGSTPNQEMSGFGARK